VAESGVRAKENYSTRSASPPGSEALAATPAWPAVKGAEAPGAAKVALSAGGVHRTKKGPALGARAPPARTVVEAVVVAAVATWVAAVAGRAQNGSAVAAAALAVRTSAAALT
jgi:hypothetical protein